MFDQTLSNLTLTKPRMQREYLKIRLFTSSWGQESQGALGQGDDPVNQSMM
jgi:hypothetical protein